MPSRNLPCFFLLSAILWSAAAAAQSFPDRPIRFLVPAAPGGTADAVGRALAEEMSRDLKVPVVVENKPGAGGVIATDIVVKAPADGYTVALVNSSHATNPVLLKELPYDTLKDTTTLSYTGYIPLVLITQPSNPINSVQELVAASKAKPKGLQFASGGIGSGGHLAVELLKYSAGIDLLHVPFQGNAPAVTAVLGGHVGYMFDTIANSRPNIEAGKLKVLAISSSQRSNLLPNVPTVAESGVKDFNVGAWIAIIARAGTPPGVLQKLNASLDKAVKSSELRARPAMQGIEFVGGSLQEADAFMRGEIDQWQKVSKAVGLGPN